MIGFEELAEAREEIFREIRDDYGDAGTWVRAQGIDHAALRAWAAADLQQHREAGGADLPADAALTIGLMIGLRVAPRLQEATA